MSETKAPAIEESFAFPKYAAFIDSPRDKAYGIGFVRQLHVSKVVPVRVGPGRGDQTVVYEYETESTTVQAVLLRNAWLRPVGSLDKTHAVKIQVLVDEDLVFEEPIEQHLKPTPGNRPCACNFWASGVACQCSTLPILPSKVWPFDAAGLDEKQQTVRSMHYGLFLPTQTLIQIRVVNPWRGGVEFQARCGITAALYSTKTGDIAP